MNRVILTTILLIFNFAFQKESIKFDVQDENPRKLEENLSDDIVILHVNDVHCGLNDTVGYDGFVLYRDEMKKKYKNVISVDVGDHIQGGSIGAISDGEAVTKLMNNIVFDVSLIGNHEFDYGVEQLHKLEKNLTSNYICSNFCYRITIYISRDCNSPFCILINRRRGSITNLTFGMSTDYHEVHIYPLIGFSGKIMILFPTNFVNAEQKPCQ